MRLSDVYTFLGDLSWPQFRYVLCVAAVRSFFAAHYVNQNFVAKDVEVVCTGERHSGEGW